jgi:hypothetical protein
MLHPLHPYYSYPIAPSVSSDHVRPRSSLVTQGSLPVEALAEQHLDTLLSGLRSVIRGKVLHAAEERAQRQLFRILKKLDTFCSTDHFERKLALYTACKLIELSNSSQSCGQHEQTMQVRPITEYMQSLHDGNFYITGHFARTCAARSMEAIWLVVCEEDGSARLVSSNYATKNTTACISM